MSPSIERLKNFILRRYKLSRQSVGFTVFVIVIFGLTLYFMDVMANVASYLSPDNTETPKLTDRLFEAIPSISLLWLTDLADAIMFIPTFILILTHYRPLYLFCKVLLTWALCNLSVSPPLPSLHFQTLVMVVYTLHGCHRFPHRFRWLAVICLALVWCLCIGSAIIVIANRAHYSVDVLVAFYVAGGNSYFWTYILDHYVEEKGRLRDLTHPWGDGPDPRAHIRRREELRQLEAAKAEKNVIATKDDEVQMLSIVTEIPPIQRSGPLAESVLSGPASEKAEVVDYEILPVVNNDSSSAYLQ
ncbi:hypothetical protein BGX26_010051 [Mortierella sp. AD094]|nr:hypothetical protein BGX26_010051 [Mortierella sp. AD094]